MGLRAPSCAAAGVYSSANTKAYVVDLARSRGVVIASATVTLDNAAICGGASGFSRVSITYDFVTVVPVLLESLGAGFTLPASACFPNNL